MKILIDTNIFYNNWYLNNAYFEYLFNFVENTNSELLISEVVVDEVEGKFNEQLVTLRQNFKKNIQLSEKLLDKTFSFNLKEVLVDYSFKTVIDNKSDYITYFDYNKISNKTLVQRAIAVTKPFGENDKGYRDSLIWLSFLEHLNTNPSKDEIVMINNNSNDFLNKDKNGLNNQLVKDLEEKKINNKFTIYTSLKDFINDKVDISQHKYTEQKALEKLIYENEDEIQDNLLNHLNFQQPNWFQTLLSETNGELKDIRYLTNYYIKIVEGIEDPELIKWSYIDEEKIFVELSLNLRIVDLHLTVPRQVYESSLLHLKSSCYNILEHGDFVTLFIVKRIYLNIAFNVIGEIFVDNIVINSFETN